MAHRHRAALGAMQTNDIIEMAKLLAGACQDASNNMIPVYLDPAVRLIANRIAFAAGGDFDGTFYYMALAEHCAMHADNEGPITKEQTPREPLHSTS